MANARANTGGLKIGLVRLGPYLLLGFLAMMVLLPIAPHLQVTPSTDLSVFLYIGQRILKGDVPYLDVWDHKGPLVYYIDAVGLGLTGGSRWGVWLLEFVFVVGAAWVGFKLLKQALGTWPALFGMVLLTLQLQLVIDGGNLTEEYSLLFQFSTLWFFWKALHDKGTMQYIFAGAAAGFCFLLRPNNIGVGLAIALYLTWLAISARKADGWKPLAALVAGGLIVLAPAALYFWAAGALPALWDQVFNFNLAYGAEGAGHRWEALVAGLPRPAHIGDIWPGGMGIGCGQLAAQDTYPWRSAVFNVGNPNRPVCRDGSDSHGRTQFSTLLHGLVTYPGIAFCHLHFLCSLELCGGEQRGAGGWPAGWLDDGRLTVRFCHTSYP